jgi:hypothetical protein
MEITQFNRVLRTYTSTSKQEADDLFLLCEKYPYSQVLHVLLARASKNLKLPEQQRLLQMAAVYAADRVALKTIMTQEVIEVEEVEEVAPVTTSDPEPIPSSTTPVNEVVDVPKFVKGAPQGTRIISDDLAQEVIEDLEKLHRLRNNFENMFKESGNESDPENNTSKPASKSVEKKTASPDAPQSTKSKRARMIELARNLQKQAESESADKSKKRKKGGETIIDEIANNRNEIIPENEKQKEQLDVIDNFIKSQPTIAPKDKNYITPPVDLSTIKTGEFGDHVVSETLVDILIKQGKKEKAIEVLKKLIWKFPQKKAYFAAQIEDLKK